MDKEHAELAAEQVLARAKSAQPLRPKRRDRTISRHGFALGSAGLGFSTGLCLGNSDTHWEFALIGLAIGVMLGVAIAGQPALSFAFSDPPPKAGSGSPWNRKTSGFVGLVVGGGWFLVNLRHFPEQGFVAIGLPLIIFALGCFYFFRHGGEPEP